MSHMSPHVWREVAMDESDMVGGSGELHGWSWRGYFGAYIERYTDRPVDSKLFRFGVCSVLDPRLRQGGVFLSALKSHLGAYTGLQPSRPHSQTTLGRPTCTVQPRPSVPQLQPSARWAECGTSRSISRSSKERIEASPRALAIVDYPTRELVRAGHAASFPRIAPAWG